MTTSRKRSRSHRRSSARAARSFDTAYFCQLTGRELRPRDLRPLRAECIDLLSWLFDCAHESVAGWRLAERSVARVRRFAFANLRRRRTPPIPIPPYGDLIFTALVLAPILKRQRAVAMSKVVAVMNACGRVIGNPPMTPEQAWAVIPSLRELVEDLSRAFAFATDLVACQAARHRSDCRPFAHAN